MKGVVITPENTIEVREFNAPLYASIHDLLDGYMEIVRPINLPEPQVMIVDDEGLLKNLPLNFIGSYLYGTAIHGNPIVGTVIIMKQGWTDNGPDIVGLDDDEAESIRDRFTAMIGDLRKSVKI